ncbi:ADP-ribosylglycohydrolase family protein [Emticicia sp. SJ17W-69]|uniref:ADP-ribosylglycohydrolase family protein n=1 Tax=Emticicia sp. SJ17W-69 TaxID=3421657 RepID=UPI003EBF3A13
MKKPTIFAIIICFGIISCTNSSNETIVFDKTPVPKLSMTEAQIYDKVLGMLVGSGIGDSMGAPTEMWTRDAIQLEYGFVDRLDSMVREPSPEGTWKINLPAGGTTDDSRWKKLASEFLLTQNSELKAEDFGSFIVQKYKSDVDNFKKIDAFSPEPYEENSRKMAWLQEWAIVAKPFVDKDYIFYHNALSRFYGGEMVCGGMLYAPTIGAFFPANPLKAYKETYKISIFDIGYARDISGLVAAMTAAAMEKNATKESVLSVLRTIDPEGFFKSRLVGRTSYRILRDALSIVKQAKAITEIDSKHPQPKRLKADTLYISQMYKAFELLDAKNQDMPFHAGEIHLQVLTAMIFSDFDFEKTIAFLVNLGRDNDTTSAVAGGILGAFYGYEKLPNEMKTKVIKIGKEQLDVDFELLAQKLTKKIIEQQ